MVDDAITSGTPFAAPPDDTGMLSQLAGLSLAFARAFQAKGVKAARDGDLAKALAAETRFSRFALGIRRAIVLMARMRGQQHAEDRDAAIAEDRDAETLSELAALGLAFAQAIQIGGSEALDAGDFDRACAAATHYNSLALGIRRAIALKAKLREQQEQARRQAEDCRDRQRAETAERRRQVAEGVAQAIAAATPDPADAEDRERLTADLWERLAEDDRGDTVLPIEVLVRRMCRALGIPHAWPALASGAAAAENPAGEDEVRTASGFRYKRGRFRRVPSAGLGRPDTEHYLLDAETGDIFPPVPDPAAPPTPATGPPPTDSELIDAEIRRREPAAWDRLHLAVHKRISALG